MSVLDVTTLITKGVPRDIATELTEKINHHLKNASKEEAWLHISREIIHYPFSLHLFLFQTLFPEWPEKLDTAAAWTPSSEDMKTTNIFQCMQEFDMHSVEDFHRWSIQHVEKFWGMMLDKLHIQFEKPPEKICDLSLGIEKPQWLVNAKMNIVNSCFNASKDKTAIIYLNKNHQLEKLSYGELERLTNRVANSLINQGLKPNDGIAIYMPMTMEAIAIYLGIIKMGGIVVAIPDSFSAEEIAIRFAIADTKAIFTQDFILRENKKIPLYEKTVAINSPKTIVLSASSTTEMPLRTIDILWDNFLVEKSDFSAYITEPHSHTNILFSSGTTATPKAIPWNHTTGIKSASDAFFHQNIQPEDILAWPTNLGWMMGPWLIFAGLINQATLAIYPYSPRDRAFGEFIQNAKVTMLGVVPALVATWRQNHCMEGLDWRALRRFSSTAECSNAEDMLYLMYLAGYKPIIEYCGGTETGGAYISSTMIQPNYPSVFTTPVMGMDFVIIDENGNLAENGEAALIPPSIGLSFELINADHHEVYYANMPTLSDGRTLRRHGDHLLRLHDQHYCILGRVDDTMKLGGIKISSAEIERVLVGVEGIIETAAIAVSPPTNGPSRLIIYAATSQNVDKESIKKTMQIRINQHLNPLFKIYDIVLVRELPKTASNKIMRRILRKNYS